MASFLAVLMLFIVDSVYGWLNFTFSPHTISMLNPGFDFSYTICINNDKTYIHYEFTSTSVTKTWLAVAFGSNKPHVGGIPNSGSPYGRYLGNDDPLSQGANSIIWGVYDANDPNGQIPYVFEYEMNNLEATTYTGTPLPTYSILEENIYNGTNYFITISRINSVGDPAHTFQFDPTASYILTQWAFNGFFDVYWYIFEHTHESRGTFIHHFPAQTVADKKTLSKTLLVDAKSGESSGIYMALEMDKNTNKITIELWGPSNKWFGIAWNGHSMGDALIYTRGDTSYPLTIGLYDYYMWGFNTPAATWVDHEGIYPDTAKNGTNDWIILNETDLANNIKYFQVERTLISTDIAGNGEVPKDVDFNIDDDSMILFVATANDTTTQLTYHDDNYWIAEVQFVASGNIGTTYSWMDKQTQNGNNVDCKIQGTLDPTNNPSVKISPTANTMNPSAAPSKPTMSPTTLSKSPSISPTKTQLAGSSFIIAPKSIVSVLMLVFVIYIQ